MIYVSWASQYEGSTDQRYFDVLIPRLIEYLLMEHGRVKFAVPETPVLLLKRGSIESVARQICENREAFFLAFVHADTGGRNQEAGIGDRGGDVAKAAYDLCGFEEERCILVAPRHEMEAWALADAAAVCATLGFRGDPTDIGLPTTPKQAEELVDPKAVLSDAIAQVRGRRRPIPPDRLFPVIAQEQSFGLLAQSRSFAGFRDSVYHALRSLGSVD